MKNGKLDNAGYSLLEVIIVAAIIALFTGFAFMSLRALNSREVDEGVKKLKMGLESNRVTTMGKLSASVSVYVDSEGYLSLEEDINGTKNTKRVGDSKLICKYKLTGTGETEQAVPNYANRITIKFDRNSGALKPQVTAPNAKYVEYFSLELGSTKVKLCIDKVTGRVSVE